MLWAVPPKPEATPVAGGGASSFHQEVLYQAYREDLKDMTKPMFLDLMVEGQILAQELGVGLEVLAPDPVSPRNG